MMSTVTKKYGTRTQVWPSGKTIEWRGEGDKLRVKSATGRWRRPSRRIRRMLEIELLAEKYHDRDILCVDSCLIDALLQNGSVEGFTIDDMENVYADPSNMDDDDKRSWLDDHGIEYTEDSDLDELVRDNSGDDPNEAYMWFRVTEWLCGKLRGVGEIVIDNDYGCWWGRGGCGQGVLMDGTLQRIAEKFCG